MASGWAIPFLARGHEGVAGVAGVAGVCAGVPDGIISMGRYSGLSKESGTGIISVAE